MHKAFQKSRIKNPINNEYKFTGKPTIFNAAPININQKIASQVT